jgi:hypothetical protein
MTDRRAHWNAACSTRRINDVSGFQQGSGLSLKLINRVGVPKDSPIIDVGGGASTLVDHLLKLGFSDLSVLDVSSSALDRAKVQLEYRVAGVEWIVADIRSWTPPKRYAVWHDRAVLRFLVERIDQLAYVGAVRAALAPEGWVIIGGFAPGGPVCGGLDIDAVSLGQLFGDEFELMEIHGEMLATSSGADRAFRHHVVRRKATLRSKCR